MLNTDQSRQIIEREEIVICDWDNVIQNIDIPWLVRVYQDREIFKDYFDEEKMNVTKKDYLLDVLGRKEYYLNDWLLKDPEKKLPSELFDKFMSYYIDDEDFYNKCAFTNLSEVVALMSEQKFCKKIVFLSHAPSQMNGVDKRKEKIFEKYKEINGIEHDKMELVVIDSSIKKHDWVKQHYPNFTTAIDDRMDIIRGYINNTGICRGIFILPRLGYNAPLDRFIEDDDKILDFARSNVIQYMNPF